MENNVLLRHTKAAGNTRNIKDRAVPDGNQSLPRTGNRQDACL